MAKDNTDTQRIYDPQRNGGGEQRRAHRGMGGIQRHRTERRRQQQPGKGIFLCGAARGQSSSTQYSSGLLRLPRQRNGGQRRGKTAYDFLGQSAPAGQF